MADPHDPDTTIEGRTLDVVVGPPLAAVDDSAITGLSEHNEAAPEGSAYVVVPITVTYREELAPGTIPTLLVGYETEDGNVTETFDDGQPSVWIDDEPNILENEVRGLKVGETISGHVFLLVDQADIDAGGFVRLGMVFGDSAGYQYVTALRGS